MSDAYQMTRAGEIIPFPPPLPWGKNESEPSYFARLGFEGDPEHSIGTRMDCLEWYERTKGEGHPYLADWKYGSRRRLIFVPDWPTLLKLQAFVAPIIQANLLVAIWEERQR